VKSMQPVVPGMDLEEIVLAKNQPPYVPLPVAIVGPRWISRWKLTWRERFKILFTGDLWHTQLTFGQPFQPTLLEIDSPKRYLEKENDQSLADA